MSEKQSFTFSVNGLKQNLNFYLKKIIHCLKFSLLKVRSSEEILHGVIWEKITFFNFLSLLQVFTEKKVTTQRFDCFIFHLIKKIELSLSNRVQRVAVYFDSGSINLHPIKSGKFAYNLQILFFLIVLQCNSIFIFIFRRLTIFL